MNYGYTPTKFDGSLSIKLKDLIKQLGPDPHGHYASIEVNGLYPGVRIRKLTHYSEDQVEWIVRKADQIYEKLAKGPIP